MNKQKCGDERPILIAGCGVSGRAAARLAARLGRPFSILDQKDSPELRAFLETLPREPERLFLGERAGDSLPRFGLAVLSPGFRKGNPILSAIRKSADRVAGELEFALEHCGKPWIGITGTNGKTTTTELTAELFRASGIRAKACGNNGYAMSDAARDCLDGLLDLPVVEVSSFQLETMEAPRPAAAAALLNLASDHIDRHGSFEAYAEAKLRLFSWNETRCVINSDLLPIAEKTLAGRIPRTFSATDSAADFHVEDGALRFHGRELARLDELRLHGRHNHENALAALALLASIRGEDALSDPRVRSALTAFASGEHRQECFLERNGIRYLNDSKATNPHAVNAALADMEPHSALILLGGLDKDMNFNELRNSSNKIRTAFLFGSCATRIADAIADVVPCVQCDGFEDAVRQATAAATPGDCVLLSPATASMDLFRDYRERGERFKELVLRFIGEDARIH